MLHPFYCNIVPLTSEKKLKNTILIYTHMHLELNGSSTL